ncbi:MAG: helix-turn-helix transcriptional regulator [Clostridia bacterium]|nr:helix-turn-helix transcriptional regulator [Clostridia bacterium]
MELPKIIACGIYDAKIPLKGKSVSKKRKTSMFEIELVCGEGGISYMDAEAYPTSPRRIICAKPGQTRFTKPPFRCYYVHALLNEGELYDILMNLPNSFETLHPENYEKLFQRLVRHYDLLSEKEELLLQSIFLELIYTLKKDAYQKEDRASFSSAAIKKALEYIGENPTEDLSLEALAQKVNLSPIHFHNLFRSAVGKTLRDYVEEQRIKKAIDQMLIGEDSLTKIAMDCGFSSQSYFSFVFRRRMGMTPRQYVKKSLEKYEI